MPRLIIDLLPDKQVKPYEIITSQDDYAVKLFDTKDPYFDEYLAYQIDTAIKVYKIDEVIFTHYGKQKIKKMERLFPKI